MKKTTKIIAGIAGAILMVGGVVACTEEDSQYKDVKDKAAAQEGYIPVNDVELSNYNRAQALYDNPSAIQWCTAFPSSTSAPIITIPIAGKLTTSNTSFFSPEERVSGYELMTPKRSVDGLYHGDSFYRYGFTPAGQYVDFSNSMELLCTTSLTEFQRQNTYVEGLGTNGDASEVDVEARQDQAEEALKNGDPEGAVDSLEGN